MKIIKYLRKKTRKSIFIFICLVSSLIFFSLMISNIEKTYKSILESNNELSHNSISLSFDINSPQSDIYKCINSMKSIENNIIYYEAPSSFDYMLSSKGVYFNGDFNYSYNILEGRFFTKEDMDSTENLAIIGKNIIEYTIIENNQRYLKQGNEKYKVIGIIGKNNLSTRYDDLVLYNLNSILSRNEYVFGNTWYIDNLSLDRSNVIKNVNSTINNNLVQISEQNFFPNPIEFSIKSSRFLVVGISFILICIFFTLVKSTIFWIKSLELEIGIRKDYGATNLTIILDIISRYLIISILSLIFSLIANKLLFVIKPFNIEAIGTSTLNVILCSILLIALGIVIISIAMLKVIKTQINDLIKK